MALLLPYRQQKRTPTVLLRPTVDVVLEYGGSQRPPWQADALVDTGATHSVFDFATAGALGVQLGDASAKTGRIRILGGTWDVQVETVQLTLAGDPEYSWAAEVGFIRDRTMRMPFQGILGADGFLDRFAVTFNQYHEYIVIERPDEVHERFGTPEVREPGLSVSPDS